MSTRIVGKNPVMECLRAGRRRPLKLYRLEQGRGLDGLCAEAEGVQTHHCSRKELDALSGGVPHQGIVLDAAPLPLFSVKDWASRGITDDALVVVLDGIEDPHNFGAIVRSAVAFGVGAVMFGNDRSAPLSPACLKSAAGAMEYINLVRVTNLVRGIKNLKAIGFWVAGLDARSGQSLWTSNLKGRLALAIGSEGKGLRRLTSENCDLHVHIPMEGPTESLNASVSMAIVLAECRRLRA